MPSLFTREEGCLEEAENLIRSKYAFEANGIIMTSFLFACAFSKDVTRAQRELNQAFHVEHYGVGTQTP